MTISMNPYGNRPNELHGVAPQSGALLVDRVGDDTRKELDASIPPSSSPLASRILTPSQERLFAAADKVPRAPAGSAAAIQKALDHFKRYPTQGNFMLFVEAYAAPSSLGYSLGYMGDPNIWRPIYVADHPYDIPLWDHYSVWRSLILELKRDDAYNADPQLIEWAEANLSYINMLFSPQNYWPGDSFWKYLVFFNDPKTTIHAIGVLNILNLKDAKGGPVDELSKLRLDQLVRLANRQGGYDKSLGDALAFIVRQSQWYDHNPNATKLWAREAMRQFAEVIVHTPTEQGNAPDLAPAAAMRYFYVQAADEGLDTQDLRDKRFPVDMRTRFESPALPNLYDAAMARYTPEQQQSIRDQCGEYANTMGALFIEPDTGIVASFGEDSPEGTADMLVFFSQAGIRYDTEEHERRMNELAEMLVADEKRYKGLVALARQSGEGADAARALIGSEKSEDPATAAMALIESYRLEALGDNAPNSVATFLRKARAEVSLWPKAAAYAEDIRLRLDLIEQLSWRISALTPQQFLGEVSGILQGRCREIVRTLFLQEEKEEDNQLRAISEFEERLRQLNRKDWDLRLLEEIRKGQK